MNRLHPSGCLWMAQKLSSGMITNLKCMLSKSSRNETSLEDTQLVQHKMETGKAIKRLNFENKSLFGALWESRKNRRKLLGSKENACTVLEDGLQQPPIARGELEWNRLRSSRKHVTMFVCRATEPVAQCHEQESLAQLESVPSNANGADVTVGTKQSSAACTAIPEKKCLVANKSERGGTCVGSVNIEDDVEELSCQVGKVVTVKDCVGDSQRAREGCVGGEMAGQTSQGKPSGFGPEGKENTRMKGHSVVEGFFPLWSPTASWQTVTPSPIQSLSWKDANAGLQEVRSFPGVSRILAESMPEAQKKALERWKEKMVAKMGAAGFQKYRQDLLGNGSALHHNIGDFLKGVSESALDILEANERHWNSIKPFLEKMNLEDVRVIESHVIHPVLKYRGVVDCVSMHRGRLILIDWKVSEKPKPQLKMTYDGPLQLAAYIGALSYDPNYLLKVDGAMLVIAIADGSPAQEFLLEPRDCEAFWQQWLLRLETFHQLHSNDE